MKACKKCGQIKGFPDFPKRRDSKDGLRSTCLECKKEKEHEYYLSRAEELKARQREWNLMNKDIKKRAAREWYLKNQEKMQESRKKWADNNPKKCAEVIKKSQEKYRRINREALNQKARRRYAANPSLFRARHEKWRNGDLDHARELSRNASSKIRRTPRGTLNDRISAGIRQALKGKKSGLKLESIVGYTLDELKTHIESQFVDGMTWEKLIGGEIHIDHIIPKSVFNFDHYSNIDFQKCWGLKNLRPMWAVENLKKHNKLDHHFQPSLSFLI